METFSDIRERYRQRTLTSERLVRDLFERIEILDPELGSFSTLFKDTAISDARRLDAEFRSGAVRGPLHGIPIAVKDLADIEGHVTTFGSQSFGTAPSAGDATFIRRLRDAGAIILGTTRMVEFALGSWGTNTSTGTPRNPLDRHRFRIAGGSSSGSAVAVAAGLVPAAIGSDTGGSIRIPASLCGVTGFKSTFGAVPLEGVASLSPTLDTIGPIARCVEDVRAVHLVLAGQAQAGGAVAPDLINLGILDPAQYGAVDRRISVAFETAIHRMRDSFASMTRFRLPRGLTDYQDISSAVIAYEAYANLGSIASNAAAIMDADVRHRVMAGSGIRAGEYDDLNQTILDDRRDFRDTFERFDFLVSPTTPIGPVELHEVDQGTIPMSRFTRYVNYLGLCAVSIPIPTEGQFPAGLQIVGAAGDDLRLLQLAEIIEAKLA